MFGRVTTKLRIKIVRKGIPRRRSVAFIQLWPSGWVDQDATYGKEIGFGPGHIVLDGDPVGTHRPTAAPPHFSAHVYCGQTVAHLSKCWALVQCFNSVEHPGFWNWRPHLGSGSTLPAGSKEGAPGWELVTKSPEKRGFGMNPRNWTVLLTW